LDFCEWAEIDDASYLPGRSLNRRNVRGIAGYLLSGAMARDFGLDPGAIVPPLERIVAMASKSTDAVFSLHFSDVDDQINALSGPTSRRA